jgi:hypothetical protein
MKYGYARVSTDGQSVDAQVRQLTQAGCKKVFREVASGAKGSVAKFGVGCGSSRERSDRASVGDSERCGDEFRLSSNVAATDVPNLSLPNDRHRLEACQCSSGRQKLPNPSPGRVGRFTFRWSCSTMLFKYFTWHSRDRRQSSPSLFISAAAFG